MRTEAEKIARNAKYRTDRGLPPDAKLQRGPKPIDLSGRKFGRLTVVWPSAYSPKNTLWFCVCDCGTMRHVRQGNITRRGSRRTYSCGCWGREKDITHGACVGGKTPEYLSYIRAKLRCTNPNGDKFKYYGGAEIAPTKFLFTSFEDWFAELGAKPGPKYSVDRINPFGNYEKGNVRWATQIEQANNKRRHYVQR